MFKTPKRPKGITQNYNDGYANFYAVENVAEPGYMVKEKLVKKIFLRYEEQRMGVTRYYAAAQSNIAIDRVIRVQRTDNLTTQDVAITEDGAQYQIEMIQIVPDVFPPSVDITLSKITQRFEVGL